VVVLKFRVWNGDGFSTLCDAFELGLIGYQIPGGSELESFFESVLIEQFVGRKDMFGTELFEGDIIQVTDGEGWVVGNHVVKIDEETLSTHQACMGKIVGNVHENPALIPTV
jgi:hypothetical protein